MNPSGARVLSAKVEGEKIILVVQAGISDGVTIYSRRAGETDYLAIADDEENPIVDDRPKINPSQPEIRSYHAILLYSGEENRQRSNEVVVTLP